MSTAPSTFDQDDIQERQLLLRGYLKVCGAVGFLFLVVSVALVFYTGNATAIRLAVATLLFNLFVAGLPFWLYRSGRLREAVIAASVTASLISPMVAMLVPTFQAPIFVMPIVGILIGFSLGDGATRRYMLWFGAVCLLAGLLCSDLFPEPESLPHRLVTTLYLADWIGGFILFATLLNSFATRLTGALQLARASNRSFSDAQQKLEATNRNLEERVLERTATLNALLECMPSGVLAVNMQGHPLVNNAAAQAITGLGSGATDARSQGLSALYGLHTLDGRPLNLRETPLDLALSGKAVTDQVYLVKHAGHPDGLHIDASARAIFDPHGHQLGGMMVFTDISQRIQAEQALTQAEQRLRSLLGNLSGMAFRAGSAPPWPLHYVSAGVEALTGWPAEHFIDGGVPWQAMMLQEDFERILTELQVQQKAGRPRHTEYRIRHRDGSLRWVEGRTAVLADAPEILAGIVTDIGPRKLAEIALAENERRFRSLVVNTPGMVFRCRKLRGWPMLYMSDRAEAMTGWTADEFVSGTRLFGDLMPPEDVLQVNETARQQLEQSGDICVEFRIRRRDGAIRWIESNSHLIRLDDGHEGYEGAMFDVTTRKRAQQALAENEARFRLITDSAPQIIWTAGPDGGIDFVSRGGVEYFGLPAGEILGSGWLSAMHPDDLKRRIEQRTRTLVSGEPIEIEYRLRRHDGEYRWHLSRGVAELDEHGQPQRWFGVITDIEDIKRAKESAEQATRMKSAFLSSMSHEIRTPMNAIIGMTSILLDTPLTSEQRDSADIIRTSGEHLLTLINDILDYSKIEAGHMRLERVPFSLRDCIESALDLVATSAHQKGVDLGYFAAAGLPDTMLGDISRLRQVLVNLMSNAIKFTPARGSVSVEVRSRALEGDDHVLEFEVRDTGIGIASEVLPHLFQSFVQADTSTTRLYGGTGLGLSICKRLVELMEGSIDVSSELGKGSTFRFSIRTTLLASTTLRTSSQDHARLSGLRALIVDDIEINRRILLHYAALWGMTAQATDSPREALEWVRRGDQFDLALLDFHMPEMNGLQLARELRKLRRETELPLMILSSVAGEMHEPGVISGAVPKPIKPSRLLEELQNVLSRHVRPAPHTSGGFALLHALGLEHPLRVLVAEDNAVNQKVASQIFRRMAYQIDFANDGIETLQAIERQTYDVVFMDVQMPLMDGLEASREICRRWPSDQRPRIVAMTANATAEDRRICELAGMDDYLSKPVVPERIAEALRRCQRRAEFA